MVLPDIAVDELAARFGQSIANLARDQFSRMLTQVRAGVAPLEAIQSSQAGFTGEFADQLAAAFSELLQRAIGVAEVRAMPVGGISLSQRLYANTRETNAQTLALVREHAQGLQQARRLALQLYDGYDPSRGAQRPLEGRARADLPKALRAVTQDPTTRRELSGLIQQGQAQAARLKSPALRAAYLQTFKAWEEGAGQEALKRRLEIAWKEKNRYFATRIAHTEMARAHQAAKADELMADDTIDVVQVVLNPRHPLRDICDMHGRADLWGLGPGCYPKARAPRPPFHPHCWCKLRSRPDLSAAGAKEVPRGEAAYLRSLGNMSQAGQVMGSRARAQKLLDGAAFDDVVNREGVDPMYRLHRLGDGGGHALVKPETDPRREFRQPGQTFGPYDPAAPKMDPDVSTPARRAAVEVEDAIRRDSRETGVFIAPDGRELLRAEGEPDRVSYLEVDLAKMRGATFTHNHPSGSSFSVADVKIGAEFGLAEIRAVTAAFRYSAAGLPDIGSEEWEREYAAAELHEVAAVRELVRLGEIHPADFGREARHKAWIRLASKFGFSYRRERS